MHTRAGHIVSPTMASLSSPGRVILFPATTCRLTARCATGRGATFSDTDVPRTAALNPGSSRHEGGWVSERVCRCRYPGHRTNRNQFPPHTTVPIAEPGGRGCPADRHPRAQAPHARPPRRLLVGAVCQPLVPCGGRRLPALLSPPKVTTHEWVAQML